MLTKNSDFIGRFKIAGSEDIEPNSQGNAEELQLFIKDFEPKCLVTVLGYTLYSEVEAELLKQPWTPGAPETTEQKWIDLIDGKDNWRGLLTVTVPYIYFYFLEDDDSHHTGVGIVKENPKGAESHIARKKAVTAWRSFYESAQGKLRHHTILGRPSHLGYIVGKIYDEDDKYWSLYKYLEENAEDFPNASPSVLSNINDYGI